MFGWGSPYNFSPKDAKYRHKRIIRLFVAIAIIVQILPRAVTFAATNVSNYSSSAGARSAETVPPIEVVNGALKQFVRAHEDLVLPNGQTAEVTVEAGSNPKENVLNDAAAYIAHAKVVVVESDLSQAETEQFIGENPELAKVMSENRDHVILAHLRNARARMSDTLTRIGLNWRRRVADAGLPPHPLLTVKDRVMGAGFAVATSGISSYVYLYIKHEPLHSVALIALTAGALNIWFNATNVYHVISDAGYLLLNRPRFKRFLESLGLKKIVSSVSSYYEFTSVATWLSYSVLTTTLYHKWGISNDVLWTALLRFISPFFYGRALYRWVRFENPPARLVSVMYRASWVRAFLMSALLNPFIIAGNNDLTSKAIIAGTILTGFSLYVGTHPAIRVRLGRAAKGVTEQLRAAWQKMSFRSSKLSCPEILQPAPAEGKSFQPDQS